MQLYFNDYARIAVLEGAMPIDNNVSHGSIRAIVMPVDVNMALNPDVAPNLRGIKIEKGIKSCQLEDSLCYASHLSGTPERYIFTKTPRKKEFSKRPQREVVDEIYQGIFRTMQNCGINEVNMPLIFYANSRREVAQAGADAVKELMANVKNGYTVEDYIEQAGLGINSFRKNVAGAIDSLLDNALIALNKDNGFDSLNIYLPPSDHSATSRSRYDMAKEVSDIAYGIMNRRLSGYRKVTME